MATEHDGVYAVEYRSGMTFCRAEGEQSALEWVKGHAYDGMLHEDEAEVIGPMSKDVADKLGEYHRKAVSP